MTVNNCSEPVLIFNPSLKWLLAVKCKRMSLFGRVYDYTNCNHITACFPWRDLYVAKSRIHVLDKDTNKYIEHPELVDQCYLIDNDGVTIPVFYYVPCGHCALCRAHKVEEWQTRCVCESAMHKYKPLFVTLTYAPSKRPDNMQDCLADFQKFMKRLRIDVDRKYGKHTLRYFAVSEWTPTNHYPHIHMLIWGLPYVVDNTSKNSFFALNNYICSRWSNGYSKTEICRDNSGVYCMKYMKKGTSPDCWFQASRRNGIGYDFAIKLLPFVLKNPDMTNFTLTDKFTGKSKTYLIPSYFRSIWFPTLSKLFPAHISRAAKQFVDDTIKLGYALFKLCPNSTFLKHIKEMHSVIASKYTLMHFDYNEDLPDPKYLQRVTNYIGFKESDGQYVMNDVRESYTYVSSRLSSDGTCLVPVRYDSLRPTSPYALGHTAVISKEDKKFPLYLVSLKRRILRNYADLLKYNYDYDEFSRRLSLTDKHSDAVISASLNSVSTRTLQDNLDVLRSDISWQNSHWSGDFVDTLY